MAEQQAASGGTIAQLRAASQAGTLQGVAPPAPQNPKPQAVPRQAAPQVAPPEQTAQDRVGDTETLGNDNASNQQDEQQVDEQQVDEQGSEDDASEWEQDLHGITTRQAIDALKAGTLPPELAKNIKIMAKINGIEVPISIEEAGKGYQRLSDYSRQKNELREQAQQVAGMRDSFDQMVQSWKGDPRALRKGMEQLGLQEPLFEAAKILATEWLQDQQLPPAERALKAQLKQMQEQHQSLMQRLEQQQNPQPDQRASQLTQQLGQMVPIAMKACGVHDSPVARTYMAENLRTLWEPGAELTDELVQMAAQATAEQLSDMAQEHQKSQAPKKTAPRPMPIRHGAAPQVGGGQGGGMRQSGATIADFKKAFQTR